MTCDNSVWKVFEFNLLPILSKAFPSSKLQQSHYHLDVLHHGSCVTTESLLTRNAVCCWPNFTLPSQTLPLSRHMSHAAWLYLCKHMLYVFRFFLNSELLFYCFYFCLITRKLLTTTVQQIRVPLFLRVVKVVARALCTGHEHDQQADQQQSSHQVFMHFGALIFTTTSQSASTKPTICSLPVITRRKFSRTSNFHQHRFCVIFKLRFHSAGCTSCSKRLPKNPQNQLPVDRKCCFPNTVTLSQDALTRYAGCGPDGVVVVVVVVISGGFTVKAPRAPAEHR